MTRMKSRACIWRGILLLCIALLPAHARAGGLSVAVIKSGQSEIYSRIAANFTRELEQVCNARPGLCGDGPPRVEVVDLESLHDLDGMQLSWAVTLGRKATLEIVDHPIGRSVLFSLLPSATWQELQRCCATQIPSNTHVLYLDQPLSRYLSLIRLAFPGRDRVGVLLGPTSSGLAPALRQAGNELDMRVEIEEVPASEDLGPHLNRLLRRCDVVLAVPDPALFNRNNLANILLTTYRRGTPLVGFSDAYTKAGAVLSLYSSQQAMGKQIADRLQQLLESPPDSSTQVFPDRFEISVNHNVAKSLGLHLPNAQDLREQLEVGR